MQGCGDEERSFVMKRERFFGLNLPGLLGFAIALGVLVPVLSAVSSPHPTPPDVSAQGVLPQTSDTSELIAKAAEEGHVLVIVGLRPATDFIPEGTLARPSAIDQQRSEIATTRQALLGSLAGYNAQAYASWDSVPYVALKVDAEALRQLVASPYVTTIQEDIPDRPTLASVTAHIGADVTWNAGFGGSGKTVVIVDTGIDADHPFYGGRVVAEACWSNGNGGGGGVTLCPNGTNSQTGLGSADALIAQCWDGTTNICAHGSHVAGIAAGRDPGGVGYDGIAPEANIIAIQVYTRFNAAADCAPDPAPCVGSYPSDQQSALDHVNNTLRANWDIAAVNMSLGGGYHTTACDGDALKPAIDNLLSNGIATVISSGNDDWTDALSAPGCISTAVTVGNVFDPSDIVTDNMHAVVDLLPRATTWTPLCRMTTTTISLAHRWPHRR
jgi:subtilisin family serine protease